ncbi:MAG: hypothetical protein R3C56_07785 [Pirellulaceae bacterium]
MNLIFEGSTRSCISLLLAKPWTSTYSTSEPSSNQEFPWAGKSAALLNMTKAYAVWYPKLWIPVLSSGQFGMSPQLNKHMRTVARLSKKMSRVLFHKMAIHQKKMAEKQLLINRFVQIGTELFIMSAACSYAHSLQSSGSEEGQHFGLG